MKILLLLMVFLFGCDLEAKHEDVSEEPRSKAAVGVRYEVVGTVDAYGIRRHSKAPVDYITLIPPPGIGGSEVGFQIPVRPGSTIRVAKVVRTNRLFDPNMTFIVELDGTPLPVAAPMRIDLFRGNEGQGYLQMNPAIYRRLPSG
jgi:hypothetical protein